MITLIVLLLILWALGFGFQVGNLIHLLLLIAVVLIVVRLAQGRTPID